MVYWTSVNLIYKTEMCVCNKSDIVDWNTDGLELLC